MLNVQQQMIKKNTLGDNLEMLAYNIKMKIKFHLIKFLMQVISELSLISKAEYTSQN